MGKRVIRRRKDRRWLREALDGRGPGAAPEYATEAGPSSDESDVAAPTSFVTSRFGNDGMPMSWTSRPIRPEERPAMLRYLEAHHLLPWDWEYDGCEGCRGVVRVSVQALDLPLACTKWILEALVVLGHSPCDEALEALERYSRSDRPEADVAVFALEECRAMSQPPLPASALS